MWKIILLFVFLHTTNCSSVRKLEFGFVVVCNETYCDNVPKIGKLAQDEIKIYYTSNDEPGFNVNTTKFSGSKAPSVVEVNVNDKITYQKMLGFGGAFTDSTGINIKSLPVRAQKKLMESYFGDDGIGYSLCRVPIGGTDFSTRTYSYDDVYRDKDLEYFALQDEDLTYKIPLIKQAQTLRNGTLKLFASAWTAPPWMKTRYAWSSYSLLQEKYMQTWADYAKKFLDEYDKHGIQYWGMTTGNEPMYGFNRPTKSKFGSMGWVPITQAAWIRENLGPILKNSTHKDVKIIIFDDNMPVLPFFVPLMINDDATLKYIDGVATHWYVDGAVADDVIDMAKSSKKDLVLFLSEACFFITPPRLGDWGRAITLLDSLFLHFKQGYQGWTDWNMVLDTKGGPNLVYPADAPIIISPDNEEFYKQPIFYVFGHFSKFAVPDSVRMNTNLSNANSNIDAVAFLRPDNLKAVMIHNKGNTTVQIQLNDGNRSSQVLDIPAKSLHTLVYNK